MDRSSPMRVLVWNQYFPPDTSATASLLRQFVVRAETDGVTVHTIQGNPSYRPTETARWKPWQLWRRTDQGLMVRSSTRARDRLSDRARNYVSFAALSSMVGLFTRCDVILVMTDPPIAVLGAALVGELRRKPVVYWLQDYHPEFMVGIGRLAPSAPVRAWSRVHRVAMRRCDRVVAIGRDMRDRLIEAGVRAERIEVVANGSAVDWSTEAVPSLALPATDKLVALHAGEIGMRGAWASTVGGARAAADVAEVVLLGDGVDADLVRQLAADTDAVRIEARLPWDEYKARLMGADVLLTMVRRGAEGYSVPSKTYELFGCGKPIVVIADASTEPARLVTELDCGVVVAPDDDGRQFGDALRVLAGDPTLRARLGANALVAKDRYRRDDAFGEVVQILRRAAQRSTDS
ncbi:MAG: glycosyltransferase family 4 protein [Acidimicrobiales bacterium]|nr:glycosyltransferase family 4 protein [Acidimicrobiales bacterium]